MNRNRGYYSQDSEGKIIIPDLEVFKAKIESLQKMGNSAVTNSFSYAMEASHLKLVLSLYENQQKGQE